MRVMACAAGEGSWSSAGAADARGQRRKSGMGWEGIVGRVQAADSSWIWISWSTDLIVATTMFQIAGCSSERAAGCCVMRQATQNSCRKLGSPYRSRRPDH